MKTRNIVVLTAFATSTFLAAALAGSANAGTIVYQDNFDNDGRATNTGIGGGLNLGFRQGNVWLEDGNLDSGKLSGNNRGSVQSLNSFNLTGGFTLTVTYTTLKGDAGNEGNNSTNRAQFGLIDAANVPAPTSDTTFSSSNNDYLSSPLAVASEKRYAIGLNITTLDANLQGLNFNNAAATNNLINLSNAQGNGQDVGADPQNPFVNTFVLSIDSAGAYSYSINGAPATTGASAFDVARNFHFFAFTQDAEHGTEITSVTLEVVPEPSSLALVGLGGMLIARRRRA